MYPDEEVNCKSINQKQVYGKDVLNYKRVYNSYLYNKLIIYFYKQLMIIYIYHVYFCNIINFKTNNRVIKIRNIIKKVIFQTNYCLQL